MTNVERPINIFEVSCENIKSYEHILLDRDGIIGHHGLPVEPSRAEHINKLILDSPDKKFTIVSNGTGDIDPINAEVIRTPPPFIKQFRPRFLKNLVEDPRKSLLVTDSFSETLTAYSVGFNVCYVQEKLTPHPYEEFFRRVSRPLRVPISKLVGLHTG